LKRPALKLRTRISIHFLALVGTWTLFVLILLGNFLTQTARDFFRDQGAQLAQLVAVECAPLVHYEDLTSLAKMLEQRTKPPSHVRYIFVTMDNNQVVWSTFSGRTPPALVNLEHTKNPGEDVAVKLIKLGDEQLFDYAAEKAGVRVRLGMSLLPVQAFTHDVTTYILWIGVAGLLGVFAIALHVSRPIEALTTAVVKAAELDPRLRSQGLLQGTAETSTMAEWFQNVVTRLEESTRQLDTSKKLAYLGEISTSIAHEINNPLGIIVLNADFLARRARAGKLDPDVAEEVERVCSAATRATLAAQKLLQFARYSTQRSPAKRKRVRPEPLIRETVELLRDRIVLADCRVEVNIAAELPRVPLDQQGIQQVLFNLLTNALDASKDGDTVRISAEVSDAFLLSVADEGCGMSDELLAQAREPFVTTKELGRGTGLGLAISESIVKTHDGELLIETSPGGTTVTVRLPLKAPQ